MFYVCRSPVRFSLLASGVIPFVLLSGCSILDSTGSDDVAIAAAIAPLPLPPASDFVSDVTNPFFPLEPGTVFTYRSDSEDDVVTVLHQTKNILGISATVVHDQVYEDGDLTEDTYDWYAQDNAGNVWYLGEASCEIENGKCVSTEGSWEAGVAGAQAGIIMWADPGAHQGENYRQEYLQGEAEDFGKVLKTGVTVTVPAGSFSGCLETMEWTPLEPGAREHKFYCPSVGLVLETSKSDRNELISVSN